MSGSNQRNQPKNQQSQQDPFTKGFIEKIEGFIKKDDVKTTEEMVKMTEKFGKFLSEKDEQDKKNTPVSSSQIRRIYGTVKTLEASGWNDKTKRQLRLFVPRLEYVTAKHKGKMFSLRDVLIKAIDYIEGEEHFKRFCEFFEAIIAYQSVAEKNKEKNHDE